MQKQAFIQSLLIIFSLCASLAMAQNRGAPSLANDDYKLNPGDIISISVWKEPDLEKDVLIRPDGKFSFPLVGDILAEGFSVEEVRGMVSQRLERYIPETVVSVTALQINGNKVYVMGQVGRPGEIIANPYIDIVKALALSGGLNAFAQPNNITVLRRTPTGQKAIPFRYNDIEKGKGLEQNIMLQAGDVVIVP
jgi:polysaccharide export outer membrane protein